MQGRPDASAIMQVVCRDFEVTRTELEGPSLCLAIVEARHVAIYLCRKFAAMSYAEIARSFGNRNHTTALHAYDKVKQSRMADKEFDRRLAALESALAPRKQ